MTGLFLHFLNAKKVKTDTESSDSNTYLDFQFVPITSMTC